MGSPENLFADNPNVRRVGYIYETDDYSMFKKMKGNREIGKVKDLRKSMKKNGFLNCPIVINDEGEIGEGQHRDYVAEELGLPIKFVVEPKLNIEQARDLNTGQKNWGIFDYVHSDAVSSKDYARFEQLANMFNYNASTIYAAMGANVTGGGVEKLIKSGRLTCSNEQYEEAVKMLSWLQTFNYLLKEKKVTGTKSNFFVALLFVRRCEGINVQTLTQRVKEHYTKKIGDNFGSVKDCVVKISEMYNHGVQTGNRVYLGDAYQKAANESLGRNFKLG